VLDAIAVAGGFRDFAKQKSIYILRQNADGTPDTDSVQLQGSREGPESCPEHQACSRVTRSSYLNMKLLQRVCVGLSCCPQRYVWSQVENTPRHLCPPSSVRRSTSDQMLTPPPVSGQSFPTSFDFRASGRITFAADWHSPVHTRTMQWGPVNRPTRERCELFGSTVHRAGRNDAATARCFDIRSRIHLLSARECLERAGPERVDQSAVPPEPARDLERSRRLPEKLQRVQPAGSGIGWGGLGRNARGEFFRDCADCGPLSNSGECGHRLPICRERHGRGQWHVYESALSRPG
jgi:hypothetical protein